MFLPNDLTNDEKDLVAEVHRQLVASEPAPATPQAVQAHRHRAEEIAAEMIHQGRSSTSSTIEDLDPSPLVDPADGIRTEAQMLEEDQDELTEDREREYEAYLAQQRRPQ